MLSWLVCIFHWGISLNSVLLFGCYFGEGNSQYICIHEAMDSRSFTPAERLRGHSARLSGGVLAHVVKIADFSLWVLLTRYTNVKMFLSLQRREKCFGRRGTPPSPPRRLWLFIVLISISKLRRWSMLQSKPSFFRLCISFPFSIYWTEETLSMLFLAVE